MAVSPELNLENMDETARLKALREYSILDTLPEPRFDRISQMATRLFKVPMALISFIDENRQWFKSCQGLNVQETPKQQTFCLHTIASDELMVVPDAVLDARFADNLWVTGELGVRFYAGAPLIAPNGAQLGTLCILDTKPRELDESDRETLRDLAALVIDELQLRQVLSTREENEGRLRLLESAIVHANDAILITEAEPINQPGPRIIYANEAFLRTTGYTLQEVMGKTPRLLQGPKTQRDQLDKIRAALEKWESVVVEMINYRKDGSEFWVELSIVPIADERGWFTHWVSIQRDITSRRESEAAHRESEARKTAIFENSLDAIVTMNADGEIVEWNQAAEKIFGYSREEAKGCDLANLIIPPAFHEAHRSGLARYLGTGEARILNHRLELPAMCADGREITVELIVTRLSTEVELLFAGFIRDLTEQKLIEAAFVAARDEAECANNAKSEFLSRMSHELRTPLNAILGFSQILQMEEGIEPLRDIVDDIHDAGRHLLLLINEVLDISRIEAGQLALSPEPVAVREVASEALILIAPLAAKVNVSIEASVILDSELYVLADRQRLVQCLLNLLANAVKYNRDNGHVDFECLSVAPGSDASENGGTEYLQIRLRDTGIGIEAEKMQRLFIPFDRLGAEQGGIEGTGLGLSLTKSLVEEMGGTLGVESTPGVGSTFWLELPIAESALPQVLNGFSDENNNSEIAIESSVLLIEDNPRNLRVIERILAHRPRIKLLAALQGKLGLELARQHQPDLILLDLHLPDMQGDAILLALKAQQSTRDIPVVILSADATLGQIERLKADGAREYITKPINVPQFLAMIDFILSGK